MSCGCGKNPQKFASESNSPSVVKFALLASPILIMALVLARVDSNSK